MIPPPLASPDVPRINDPHPSGSHNVATIREAVAIADFASAAVAAKAESDDRKSELRTTIGIVVVALATIFGAWRVVLSEAKAQTDAGMAPVEKRMTIVEQERAREQAITDAWRAKVERRFEMQDAKQDLVLDALRVPLWKRPEPPTKDGGK